MEKSKAIFFKVRNYLYNFFSKPKKDEVKYEDNQLSIGSNTKKSKNHNSTIRILNKHGVHCRDECNNTSLHYAAMDGNIVMFKCLLQKGAYINNKNYNFDSVLHCAARNGHAQIVSIILKKGIFIDATNKLQNTSLHCAVIGNHVKVAELLINHGAQLDIVNINHENVLDCANNYKILKLLLNKNSKLTGLNNKNILHIAIERNFTELVIPCIEKRINPRSKTSEDETALHIAARMGNDQVVTILLLKYKGLDILCRNKSGDLAIHLAAQNGFYRIVELFLERNVDINIENGKHQSSLQLAINHGFEYLTELLLRRGANMNFVDSNKWSPMHHLIWNQYQHEDLIILLLNSRELDINLTNDKRRTYLSLAAEEGNENIVQLLLSKGAYIHILDCNKWSPIHHAIWNGNKSVVKMLLDSNQNININVLSSTGRTYLSLAAEKGNEYIFRLLISKGANINSVDLSNRSILHYAVSHGHTRIVELILFNKKVDINLKGLYFDYYRTALSIAAEKGYEEIVKLLLVRGADQSISASKTPDNGLVEFTLPLNYAQVENNYKIVNILKRSQ